MKHPMQPVVMDCGVPRFKKNKLVDFLLEWASSRGMSLNELAELPFSKRDRSQFAQLIGYSVSGYGDLSYACDVKEADEAADKLIADLNHKGAANADGRRDQEDA